MGWGDIIQINKSGFLFDLDGTLVDTSDVEFKSFNISLSKLEGGKLSKQSYVELFRECENFEKVLERIGIVSAKERFYEVFHRNLTRLTKEYISSGRMDTYNGSVEFVKLLKENEKKTGIFTDSNRSAAMKKIRHFDLDRHVDTVIAGNDVERRKPSPEGIVKFCREHDMEPYEVVFIGDTEADVKAGESAGVDVILFTSDKNSEQKSNPCFSEYSKLINEIEGGVKN